MLLYCALLSELILNNNRPRAFTVFLFAVVFAMRMNAAGILLPVGFDFGSAVLTVDLVKGNNCDFLSIRYYFQIYYVYFTVHVFFTFWKTTGSILF